MNKKQRKQLLKIILSCTILIISLLVSFNQKMINKVLYVIAYLIVGYDIVFKAIRNIARGSFLDENFLMTLATIGAFFIGEWEEAVAVMLFYQIGELFQSIAVDKSRKSIVSLMDIRPDFAHVIRKNKIERVNPDEVKIGEIILVRPGEKIPLDGMIIEGNSMLNTVALTGESIPKKVGVNDEVLSGCVNNQEILKMKVTKEFSESTVSKILDLVENASNRKSKSENFISKFAKIYTPLVVFIAVCIAIIPPFFLKEVSFEVWLYRALSFLVVSCPCALVISIPLSFFGGLGAASKKGILIKGSSYLEALSNSEIIVFDKTGTLTEGNFKVQEINAIGYSKKELLKLVTYAENFSNHPISFSLKQAYGQEIDETLITKTKEISGQGIQAEVEGKKVLVGNQMLMANHHVVIPKAKEDNSIIYIAVDGKYAGLIKLEDKIKESSYDAIETLKKKNLKTVMLTGDRNKISKKVALELNLDEYHAELLPQDKVAWIEKLMYQKSPLGKLIFIGDGINDAPVLALSDIGIAMGGLGSDAAIEASDIVIMTDEPSKIVEAIQISKKTMKIVKENIIFAITVKIGILLLSALGLTNMWGAVFADVGVSVLAIINALRVLRIKE